jgi:hypothetical protein
VIHLKPPPCIRLDLRNGGTKDHAFWLRLHCGASNSDPLFISYNTLYFSLLLPKSSKAGKKRN